MERVERHPTGIVRPENHGLLVARTASAVPEMRSDVPHFVDTPERERLAERLVLDDPHGMETGTWVVAGHHAGRLAAGYLTGTPVSGGDAADQVPGWASAFWWGLIARDTGVFDEFQFEWLELLQNAWVDAGIAASGRKTVSHNRSRRHRTRCASWPPDCPGSTRIPGPPVSSGRGSGAAN
ncbi:hypothetical protein LTV02_18710 [Nocardia yamanashiensis]|uniref:hypothetical protein n=1 Tax=Nocardia yamanashiensis TaxID=209247 RepID=UPI001E4CB207|nr:hypothetical protein [Nocardia yamanashiensis]UGT45288.1 hypothetical protein LTV02_18710 [Nocardia yamanashiensis]